MFFGIIQLYGIEKNANRMKFTQITIVTDGFAAMIHPNYVISIT